MWKSSLLLLGVLVLADMRLCAQPVDLPAGQMQAKARTACLECHDAHIILQQRLDKKAWSKEVDKMIRWGALVETRDRDALVDYLSGNFSPDKAPYTPARSKSNH